MPAPLWVDHAEETFNPQGLIKSQKLAHSGAHALDARYRKPKPQARNGKPRPKFAHPNTAYVPARRCELSAFAQSIARGLGAGLAALRGMDTAAACALAAFSAAPVWREDCHHSFGAGGARIWYPPNLTMHDHAVLADGVICYNMAQICIGARSIVSQRAVLCGGTHDFTRATRPLITQPITIEPDVWIASEAFIGPGVTVREGCVIGARAVVMGAVQPWTVYAGNPAKAVKVRNFDANN
jgi:putative colanic acid biosynthesis acetyltransferase WcaF